MVSTDSTTFNFKITEPTISPNVTVNNNNNNYNLTQLPLNWPNYNLNEKRKFFNENNEDLVTGEELFSKLGYQEFGQMSLQEKREWVAERELLWENNVSSITTVNTGTA